MKLFSRKRADSTNSMSSFGSKKSSAKLPPTPNSSTSKGIKAFRPRFFSKQGNANSEDSSRKRRSSSHASDASFTSNVSNIVKSTLKIPSKLFRKRRSSFSSQNDNDHYNGSGFGMNSSFASLNSDAPGEGKGGEHKSDEISEADSQQSWDEYDEYDNEMAIEDDEALREEVHIRLLAFYHTHNPSKVGDLGLIEEKYEGREDVLFHKLSQQYGVEVLSYQDSMDYLNNNGLLDNEVYDYGERETIDDNNDEEYSLREHFDDDYSPKENFDNNNEYSPEASVDNKNEYSPEASVDNNNEYSPEASVDNNNEYSPEASVDNNNEYSPEASIHSSSSIQTELKLNDADSLNTSEQPSAATHQQTIATINGNNKSHRDSDNATRQHGKLTGTMKENVSQDVTPSEREELVPSTIWVKGDPMQPSIGIECHELLSGEPKYILIKLKSDLMRNMSNSQLSETLHNMLKGSGCDVPLPLLEPQLRYLQEESELLDKHAIVNTTVSVTEESTTTVKVTSGTIERVESETNDNQSQSSTSPKLIQAESKVMKVAAQLESKEFENIGDSDDDVADNLLWVNRDSDNNVSNHPNNSSDEVCSFEDGLSQGTVHLDDSERASKSSSLESNNEAHSRQGTSHVPHSTTEPVDSQLNTGVGESDSQLSVDDGTGSQPQFDQTGEQIEVTDESNNEKHDDVEGFPTQEEEEEKPKATRRKSLKDGRLFEERGPFETKPEWLRRKHLLFCAIREFVDTEVDYAMDLAVVSETVMKTFSSRRLGSIGLTKDDHRKVLDMLKAWAMLAPVHQSFSKALSEACLASPTQHVSNAKGRRHSIHPVEKPIVVLLESALDSLYTLTRTMLLPKLEEVYGLYCVKYPQVLEIYSKELTRNKTFSQFNASCLDALVAELSKKGCTGQPMGLESYFIRPVQRFCRYPLLIQAIVKHLQDMSVAEPDPREAMKFLQSQFEDVVKGVNTNQMDVDRVAALAEINGRLRWGVDKQDEASMSFLEPHRRLEQLVSAHVMVKHGREEDGFHPRLLVLFNDVVLIVVARKSWRNPTVKVYDVFSVIPLKGSNVSPVAVTDEQLEAGGILGYETIALEGARNSSDGEKETWIIALRNLEKCEDLFDVLDRLCSETSIADRPLSGVIQDLRKVNYSSKKYESSFARQMVRARATLWSGARSLAEGGATIIQKTFRGMLGRKNAKKRRHEVLVEARSAVVIQCAFRRMIRRRRLRELRRQEIVRRERRRSSVTSMQSHGGEFKSTDDELVSVQFREALDGEHEDELIPPNLHALDTGLVIVEDTQLALSAIELDREAMEGFKQFSPLHQENVTRHFSSDDEFEEPSDQGENQIGLGNGDGNSIDPYDELFGDVYSDLDDSLAV